MSLYCAALSSSMENNFGWTVSYTCRRVLGQVLDAYASSNILLFILMSVLNDQSSHTAPGHTPARAALPCWPFLALLAAVGGSRSHGQPPVVTAPEIGVPDVTCHLTPIVALGSLVRCYSPSVAWVFCCRLVKN